MLHSRVLLPLCGRWVISPYLPKVLSTHCLIMVVNFISRFFSFFLFFLFFSSIITWLIICRPVPATAALTQFSRWVCATFYKDTKKLRNNLSQIKTWRKKIKFQTWLTLTVIWRMLVTIDCVERLKKLILIFRIICSFFFCFFLFLSQQKWTLRYSQVRGHWVNAARWLAPVRRRQLAEIIGGVSGHRKNSTLRHARAKKKKTILLI